MEQTLASAGRLLAGRNGGKRARLSVGGDNEARVSVGGGDDDQYEEEVSGHYVTYWVALILLLILLPILWFVFCVHLPLLAP